MRPVAVTSVALLGSLLLACSGLRSKDTPDQTYVLEAAAPAAGAAAVPGVLAVLRPAVQPGLDTSQIMLTRAGQELDHFAASRWGESLPQVIGALVIESLSGGGGFANVVDSSRAAVASDYELLLTVRHFEAVYDSPGAAPIAHVVLECALTAGTPRRIIGRCDAAADEPAGANRVSAIVAALEHAAQRALADVRTAAVAAATHAK